MRISGRKENQMREVSLKRNVSKYAEGSCLVKFGDTHVLTTATLEEKVPMWIRNSKRGWITAEYGMFPRSTGSRMKREAVSGRQGGRTQEIQRLIGRSLRSVVDLVALGSHQIIVDCDVIQADGGTRTAAITGAWIALHDCLKYMEIRDRKFRLSQVLKGHVAAISCGILSGYPIVDLDYEEDSTIDVDANFVMTDSGNIVEVQGSAERATFSQDIFFSMMNLAKNKIDDLINLQKDVISK
ncbi:ribonuclease PH [Candidatus Liberibacter africanus]|uniref:Ribonuclease PH n=1 Tax=Candidatus Liberibacter africanus PTSAPSY TaxID=1277257 RepID=A0A0G3I929_LIBAF|nr:ribonuclease PH [Candidatus Liberibacter africanus]AKK20277.1 ribonuclease PH [Candidatus Liberibacter africanus PTSAPSY]QTP64404.1 ribonuclease PH [Candidatus Liberibacter africanus]